MLGVALVFVTPNVGSAQERPQQSTARERAQDLHEAGIRSLDALAFGRAREEFEAALEAFPTVGTAFNLGLVYRELARPHDAVMLWGRLLDGDFGEIGTAAREQVQQMRQEALESVAHLEVRVDRPERVFLRIDGEPMGEVVRGESVGFDLNPGSRVVDARAPDAVPRVVRVDLGRGEGRTLSIALDPEPSRDTNLFEHPAFWTGVGAVVLAGVVAIVVVATGPHYGEPSLSEPFGVVATLRSR